MQIKLTHKKEFHSSISNGHGHNISVDNNTDVNPKGPSPMELVLMGVAGCSSIGIVRILKQQKIYFNNLEIIVDGKTKNSHPKVFTEIHAKVYVYGDNYKTKDGTCERDYIHIKDICVAIKKSVMKFINYG